MHVTVDVTAVQSLHACYLLLLFIPYNDWGVMSTPHSVVAVSVHVLCQNPSLSLTLTYYSSCSHLRPKTINTVHSVLKEERRNVNKEIYSFMFIPLMLIAYWVIIILFVFNSESIQYRDIAIPRHSPV